MKIVEHRFKPGTICFLDEEAGKRTYWFSANNLFQGLIDNEQAVEQITSWSKEQLLQVISDMEIEEKDWVDYIYDHEPVISKV
jgi:hypothetical protein